MHCYLSIVAGHAHSLRVRDWQRWGKKKRALRRAFI
jgi:hypothetical protein